MIPFQSKNQFLRDCNISRPFLASSFDVGPRTVGNTLNLAFATITRILKPKPAKLPSPTSSHVKTKSRVAKLHVK